MPKLRTQVAGREITKLHDELHRLRYRIREMETYCDHEFPQIGDACRYMLDMHDYPSQQGRHGFISDFREYLRNHYPRTRKT